MPYRAQTTRDERPRRDDRRPSSYERGYNKRWQKARLLFLAAHPLCAECEREGKVEPATVVDHVVPHRGDYGRMWDEGNWQALCAWHHNRKTVLEGAFGRVVE